MAVNKLKDEIKDIVKASWLERVLIKDTLKDIKKTLGPSLHE